jgi:phosphoglycerate kinase
VEIHRSNFISTKGVACIFSRPVLYFHSIDCRAQHPQQSLSLRLIVQPFVPILTEMKSLQTASLSNKRVLVRVDFNVPLDAERHITDDRRIRESLPTIQFLLDQGASLVLMSHFGRPKNGYETKYSLVPVFEHLKQLLPNNAILFAPDCISPAAERLARELQPGQIMLLENLRFHPEEEKGDVAFAQQLAQLGDCYVNDAFGTAHRAHASIATIGQFFTEKYPGFLMEAEISNAKKVLEEAESPFVAILGGSKVSDKIQLIRRLLERIDKLIIGGGMSYTFIKALGHNVGRSLCELDHLDTAREILEYAAAKNVEVLIPTDSIMSLVLDDPSEARLRMSRDIPDEYIGVDIGPETRKAAMVAIAGAKTILWNGPVGIAEIKGFHGGTVIIARAVAEETAKGAYSLIGGGDTAAIVEKLGFRDAYSYISTGGGALLTYLEGETMPGIAALE